MSEPEAVSVVTTTPGGEAVQHLRRLVGTWLGRGLADYPTIVRSEYDEELRVEWDAGREVLCYEQRVVLADGSPSHRETGYLRVLPDGMVQLWNAQKNGRTEALSGALTWDDSRRELRIDLASVAFGNDPRMLQSTRRFTITDDTLEYELTMATTTVAEGPMLPHLSARLARQP